jgi:hypothetical protein
MECSEMIYQLFIDFKKAYYSVRREVLYNNFIELGVLMELVRPIKIPSDETFMYYVRFEVFTAMSMKKVVFWDLVPCSYR